MSILGTKYKVGCMLNIGCDEHDNPTFGKVIKMCVVNKNISDIIFVISKLNTTDFSEHYQSFEVATDGRQLAIVHHKDLDSFLPLSLAKPFEGPQKKTSPSNFGKIEHCQKHSKFHMQVCLCVLYTDLYLISCVFSFLSIIIVCRNENKVLAAFILHSQPVV